MMRLQDDLNAAMAEEMTLDTNEDTNDGAFQDQRKLDCYYQLFIFLLYLLCLKKLRKNNNQHQLIDYYEQL